MHRTQETKIPPDVILFAIDDNYEISDGQAISYCMSETDESKKTFGK